MACQREQHTSRHLGNRQVRADRAFKIRCVAPDQAPAAIRQGNGDEMRAAGTGKGQNRQVLTIQRMARVSDRHPRD